MARSVGNIGMRKYDDAIITKYYTDASATEHEACRVLTIDTVNGDDNVVYGTSEATYPLGISLEKVDTVATQLVKSVSLQTDGIAMIETGGVVDFGDSVQASTAGVVIGGSATGFVVGIALKTATSGEIIPVELNKYYHA